MPTKPSGDEDRLWDVPEEEDDGENVGCREVAEDMAGKATSVILLVLFVCLLL